MTQSDIRTQQIYDKGKKEAVGLEKTYSEKSAVLLGAYSKALAELGYDQQDMVDPVKAKKAARLMFSDKYLGNEEHNPLLKSDPAFAGYSGMSRDADKQRAFRSAFGLDEQSLTKENGLIDQAGFKLPGFSGYLERHFDQMKSQDLTSMLWSKVYDPEKSLCENIDKYTKVLGSDPMLAYHDAGIDSRRVTSLDQLAGLLADSMSGDLTQKELAQKWGADLN